MAITAAQVKELREATGVGMMECKKALTECDGNMEKAMEWLRKKGIASAEKKAGRVAAEGVVESYIHMGGRIGVMIELACAEITDDVRTISHDLVMHIAAANPQFVRREEVPTSNLEKEREVLTQQALNEGKPAKIVERMVEGRIEKYYKEVCLLEQPFVKDPDINVKKMIGGKADVVRFVRFERGEGLEKRQDNLAADIAAEQAKMKK